jgi:hypothetical protein
MIRGLSLQSSGVKFRAAWQQILVLMHPDAPLVEDSALEWLCDGMIGCSDLPPSLEFAYVGWGSFQPPVSHAEYLGRITTLSQEADSGTYSPTGQWEFLVPEDQSVLLALGVARFRLVAVSTGYWIRLFPLHESWGMVLWWCPQVEPSICLPFMLGTAAGSSQVLALHEVFWEFWRDLRVFGSPQLSDSSGTS